MSNSILVQDDWSTGTSGATVGGVWTRGGAGLVYSTPLGTIENSNTNFVPANTLTQDSGELYHSCEMTIDTQGTNDVLQGGPVICGVDNSNFMCLSITSSNVRFRAILNGGSGPIGDTFIRTHVDGDLYRLERALSNYIELFVNDVFAMRWPVPSQLVTGTRVGVTDRSNGVAPNKQYGALKSKKVLPNLRSFRWRELNRWSNATEGFAYNNFSGSYWVRLNQNISLTGNFELRVQVRQTSVINPEIIFASAQNTNGGTNIRFQRGFGGNMNVFTEGADYTISDTTAITDALSSNNVMQFRMRREDDIISIYINEVLYDSRFNNAEILINGFARGQNSTGSSGVQYYSWVLQREDNTIAAAFLPAKREIGIGNTLINRSADGGANASILLIPTVATHQWDRYQEGDIPGLDLTEQGLVIEPF